VNGEAVVDGSGRPREGADREVGAVEGVVEHRGPEEDAVDRGPRGVDPAGITDYSRSVLPYTGIVGESSERSAHAMAHMVGHFAASTSDPVDPDGGPGRHRHQPQQYSQPFDRVNAGFSV
jgi:hypothetical protein